MEAWPPDGSAPSTQGGQGAGETLTRSGAGKETARSHTRGVVG